MLLEELEKLDLEVLNGLPIAAELGGRHLSHVVPVMSSAVCVVVTQHSAVVRLAELPVDVRNVIAGNDRLASFHVAPYLISKNATVREFKPFIF